MKKTIYIFTNAMMPDIIKIGLTSNVEQELWSLSSNEGVPARFECYYSCEFENGEEIEKEIHDGLGVCCIDSKKGFFKFNTEGAKTLIEGYALRGQDKAISTKRKKRSPFKFSMINIPVGSVPVGSTLVFFNGQTGIIDKTKIATLISIEKNQIEFEGIKGKVSPVASRVLKKYFGAANDVSVRGPDYWMFEGETLSQRRDRIEKINK